MAGDIVVCELLCFAMNRIDNTSNDIIIKLCTDFYSPKEIEHAKELLHNACSQSRTDLERLRPRKGPKKAQSDMTDILQLVHEMGTDVPCFVAVNLAKLPVLGMENNNLAAMVADIVSLKKQMAELKCFVQRVDTVESNRSPLVATVAAPHIVNPSLDKSPTLNDSDSETDETFPKTIDSCVIQPNADTDIAQQQQQAADQLTSYVDAVNRDEPFSVVSPKRQYKKKAFLSGQHAASNPQRGRRTNNTHRASHKDVVIGSGTQTRSLKAAKHNSSTSNSDGIFVSRLRAGTTFNDMRDHLFRHAGLRLKCVPIRSRNDHLYASFRIVCNAGEMKRLLVSEMWPKGVIETWLSPSEVVILKALHPDLYADGVSAFQDDEQLIGRPRDNDDDYHKFVAVIGKAIGIIGTSPTLNACIIGDFNACTIRNTLFGKEIRLMCDGNDHFPLAMSFELPTSELSGPEPVRSTTIRANTASWERATKSDIEAYHRRCSPLLSSIGIPHVALLCSDAQCDNISHREAISKLYRDI
ncbi:hypothetical protein CAPTEDRAFT_196327 [Capitella teleta]|uniref:Uncharacterized protein n=1 Tax=Capitella teleta TaxID=283909 RepID=R7T918_CAPTE|nr:hypothetical protein CAPTEDRAFT_196327 [Capitella teleta]|eukprot:ELT87895.1 hypothetical protein CAPTEDRAFT_196327 [Capitella teleta]